MLGPGVVSNSSDRSTILVAMGSECRPNNPKCCEMLPRGMTALPSLQHENELQVESQRLTKMEKGRCREI